jgi:hypothetical protein
LDPTIEALYVQMPKVGYGLEAVAEKWAESEKYDKLLALIKQKARHAGDKILVDQEMFKLMDKDAFAKNFKALHHQLTLETLGLDQAKREQFRSQLRYFFPKSELATITDKLLSSQRIDVESELLPSFARKMVRKYIVHKGPNCFHAAMAFQSHKFTRNHYFPVKRNDGYHSAMINYDELWQMLSTNFYDVTTTSFTDLKYGDVVIFFEVPKEVTRNGSSPKEPEFRWIRHALTYLTNGYTFSKGSKSPNTPYSIKKLRDEWFQWKSYTKNMRAKVYRLNAKQSRHKIPQSLTDWIY